jgi:hypothetical protein
MTVILLHPMQMIANLKNAVLLNSIHPHVAASLQGLSPYTPIRTQNQQ